MIQAGSFVIIEDNQLIGVTGVERPVALITGASSGIGLETVFALAQQQFQVIATMRDQSKKERVIKRAKELGLENQVDIRILDVTHPEEVSSLAKQVWSDYQRLHVLINNAGIAVTGSCEEIDLSEWRKQFETNFFGVVNVTKAFLSYLREQGSGRIINISSGAAFLGSPFTAPYTASKCAVEGLSESLRLELLPFGIQVILVEPGFYQTKILKQMERTTANSPYAQYDQHVQAFVGKFSRQAKSPQIVAQKIAAIATAKRPRMRYICGSDARLLYWLKRILPFSWIEGIFQRLK